MPATCGPRARQTCAKARSCRAARHRKLPPKNAFFDGPAQLCSASGFRNVCRYPSIYCYAQTEPPPHMLRHKDKIRLTPKEQVAYQVATGASTPPKTVTEHDAGLERAAKVWENGESAEEHLAAMLARDMKVEPDASPPAASGTI